MDQDELIVRSYYHGKDEKKEIPPEEGAKITEKLILYAKAYKKMKYTGDSNRKEEDA